MTPRLLKAGRVVRCLVRDPRRLHGLPWGGEVETVRGDVLQARYSAPRPAGRRVAYHLIHSTGTEADFENRDREAARHFAVAARQAGVRRNIYLGGLGHPDARLSPHLQSRQETGEALGSSGVPVTESRATVIVGRGSLSFEMIRALTERLPVMIRPRWVYARTQPIANANVLDYLVGVLDVEESAGRILEIGGADVLTYGDMMRGCTRVRGRWRLLMPVPVLAPRLSSYWLHLVTPLETRVGRHLIKAFGTKSSSGIRRPGGCSPTSN